MRRKGLEPAASIIRAFDGVPQVAEITGRSRNCVYRWMRTEQDGGTGGEIPAKPRRILREHAERKGLKIPPEVWIGRSAAVGAE